MVQGYYTLEEAAKILGMDSDQLREKSKQHEIRAFADRGTMRFRTQDVDELARRLGIGSDPELQMGEVSAKGSSGRLPKVDVKGGEEPLFDFDLSGSDDLGIQLEDSKTNRKKSSGVLSQGSSGSKEPKTGGELFEFELSSESNEDLDMVDAPTPDPADADAPIGFKEESGQPTTNKHKTSLPKGSGKTNLSGQTSKVRKTGMSESGPESGAKLVPMDDDGIPLPRKDSEIKLSTADSDLPVTEEVQIDDLDAELRLAEDESPRKKSSGVLRSKVQPSDSSPFELSEDDIGEGPGEPTKKIVKGGSSGKLGKGGSSGKLRSKVQEPAKPDDDDDEVSLGDLQLGEGDFSSASGASGINLHLPADTGIGLDRAPTSGEGNDDVEFELSLDVGEDDLTPAPAASASSSALESADDSFELTLDEGGDLSGEESSADSAEAGGEKDIFETDFDIPALDASGSQAVMLDEADTDLESGSEEFEIDSSSIEQEMPPLDASQSAVVALDEEDSGEIDGSAVVSEEEDELAEMTEPVDEDEEEEEEGVAVSGVPLAPAPWGPLPTIFMLPCVVVMFLVGLMTFEMLHGIWGYRQPSSPSSVVLRPVASLFNYGPDDLPKDTK